MGRRDRLLGLLIFSALVWPLSASAQAGSQAEARVRSLQPQPWAAATNAPDVTDVHGLTRAPSGILWIATGHGLVRLDGRDVEIFGGADSSAPSKLFDVALDASGHLMAAAEDGAYRFDGRRFVVLSRPGTGGRPWTARKMLRSHDSVLWIASADSLLRLEPGAFTLRQGLPGVTAHLLWEDPWGYLWATSQSGQIFRRLGSAFQPVNFPLGMGDGVVRCLWVNEGDLWLMHSDTTWRIDGDFERAGLPRAATRVDSLAGLGVTGCASDPSGGLWLASSSGLEYLAPDGSRAELPGVGGSIRALLPTEDGSLWVGTAESLYLFLDPSVPTTTPSVLVTRTFIDGEDVTGGSPSGGLSGGPSGSLHVDLPAGSDEVRLELATPTFRDVSGVRIRYLWGDPATGAPAPAATDWSQLGGTELVLERPPLGRNPLILQAGRGDSWNEPGTTVWIDREPSLWQSRTFWAAVGAGLAALVVWLLYLRWVGPGHSPLELPEEIDDDIVHLEDLDTDELTVSRESVERAKRDIFGERPDDT